MAKILLVEDDNNLREIYEARLMAEGYDIVSARDGEEALTVAMKERPDLIISDVMMPKISGFDMLDIIRSTEETKNAKVIMMTALSQAEDKERAAKLGADRYLVKSQVTLEDVAKVAREVLAGDSDGNSTPAPEPAVAAPAIAKVPTVPQPAAPEPVVASAPAPEPTAAAPVVAPAPEPVVAAPDPVVAPAPEPTAAPTPAPAVPEPTTVAAPTVAEPEQSAKDVASKAMESIMPQAATESAPVTTEQPIEDEQSAIAAQIENFIETNKSDSAKTEPTKAPEPAPAPTPEEAPKTEPAKAEESTDTSSGSTPKKVIQPISDPNASKGPDLENLLKKEEEKQQMQEIAKTVAAGKADVAEERSAEAALKKAAINPATPPDQENVSDAPQVAITENGDLQVKSEPAPEPQPSEPAPEQTQATDPVIPHQNGGNIDGIVQQPQNPQQPQTKVDPNSIAL